MHSFVRCTIYFSHCHYETMASITLAVAIASMRHSYCSRKCSFIILNFSALCSRFWYLIRPPYKAIWYGVQWRTWRVTDCEKEERQQGTKCKNERRPKGTGKIIEQSLGATLTLLFIQRMSQAAFCITHKNLTSRVTWSLWDTLWIIVWMNNICCPWERLETYWINKASSVHVGGLLSKSVGGKTQSEWKNSAWRYSKICLHVVHSPMQLIGIP